MDEVVHRGDRAAVGDPHCRTKDDPRLVCGADYEGPATNEHAANHEDGQTMLMGKDGAALVWTQPFRIDGWDRSVSPGGARGCSHVPDLSDKTFDLNV